jgi:hypothetical protein
MVCKTCGNQIVQYDAKEVGHLLKSKHSLWTWEEQEVGTKTDVPGLGEVELVYNTYLGVDDNGEIKLVWSTRCGFVGVTGYYSSYNGSEYGEFQPAERKTREAVYFE